MRHLEHLFMFFNKTVTFFAEKTAINLERWFADPEKYSLGSREKSDIFSKEVAFISSFTFRAATFW